MKTCKHCKEEVKDGAKRCPHCRGDLRGFFGRHPIFSGCLSIIIIFFIFSAVIGNLALKSVKDSGHTISSSSSSAPTPIPEAKRQDLANTYCATHKPSFELHGETLAQGTCNDVIKTLADTNVGYDDIKKIAEGTIWMGMSSNEAILAIGPASDINSTTTSVGEHQQWVYGSGIGANYLYFDGPDKDSLKLTSWQNF